jgi:hypothetical protein
VSCVFAVVRSVYVPSRAEGPSYKSLGRVSPTSGGPGKMPENSPRPERPTQEPAPLVPPLSGLGDWLGTMGGEQMIGKGRGKRRKGSMPRLCPIAAAVLPPPGISSASRSFQDLNPPASGRLSCRAKKHRCVCFLPWVAISLRSHVEHSHLLITLKNNHRVPLGT